MAVLGVIVWQCCQRWKEWESNLVRDPFNEASMTVDLGTLACRLQFEPRNASRRILVTTYSPGNTYSGNVSIAELDKQPNEAKVTCRLCELKEFREVRWCGLESSHRSLVVGTSGAGNSLEFRDVDLSGKEVTPVRRDGAFPNRRAIFTWESGYCISEQETTNVLMMSDQSRHLYFSVASDDIRDKESWVERLECLEMSDAARAFRGGYFINSIDMSLDSQRLAIAISTYRGGNILLATCTEIEDLRSAVSVTGSDKWVICDTMVRGPAEVAFVPDSHDLAICKASGVYLATIKNGLVVKSKSIVSDKFDIPSDESELDYGATTDRMVFRMSVPLCSVSTGSKRIAFCAQTRSGVVDCSTGEMVMSSTVVAKSCGISHDGRCAVFLLDSRGKAVVVEL